MVGDDKRLLIGMGALMPLLGVSWLADWLGIPFDLVYWSGALALSLYILKGRPR